MVSGFRGSGLSALQSLLKKRGLVVEDLGFSALGVQGFRVCKKSPGYNALHLCLLSPPLSQAGPYGSVVPLRLDKHSKP